MERSIICSTKGFAQQEVCELIAVIVREISAAKERNP
jgi:hypothetical protein